MNDNVFITDGDRIAEKITSYSLLKSDWDGYGGTAPNARSITETLLWLRSLPLGCPPLKPMLSGTGEVGLYWDDGRFYCDIGFCGDGTFSYYFEAPDGECMGGENIELETFPEPLLGFFHSLHRSAV